MVKRLGLVTGLLAALTGTAALVSTPAAFGVSTSKLSGTIGGPYSVGSTVVDGSPALGDDLHFDVTYAGFKAFLAPYVYAACYQGSAQVYGELKPAGSGVADFPHFGYDSQWSVSGGAANCVVSLVAYAGVTHGGTVATLSSVAFPAQG
jgi:hypothetical protein